MPNPGGHDQGLEAIIDTVGHYARPDIVRLQYMKPEEAALAENN
jgi:hypothetical protein